MKNKKIFKQTFMAMMIAIEMILMFTPLGYVPIGVLRITTMHIPVILTGIVLGVKSGVLMGFIFGLSSIIYNTINPTVTSFIFSPLIEIGGFSGNGWSIVIAIIPRICLGLSAAMVFNYIKNKKIAVLASACISTLIHTLLVLGGVYIFFGQSYALARGIEYSALIGILLGTMLTNGVLEILIAMFISYFMINILKKV